MTIVWNAVEHHWNTRNKHKQLITNNLKLKTHLAFLIPRERVSKTVIAIENVVLKR